MVEMTISIDIGDRKILRELQRNARLSNIDLAARVGMSPSTCLRRTRALEEAGIISGYVAVVDPAALGSSISLYIMIDLDQRIETDAKMFFDKIARDDRIVECVALTGTHDILVRAVVRDNGRHGAVDDGYIVETAECAEPHVEYRDAADKTGSTALVMKGEERRSMARLAPTGTPAA